MNISGLTVLSTTESYSSADGAGGGLGGGVFMSPFPQVYFPVRTKLRYIYLLPTPSGTEYVSRAEYFAFIAKYTPVPYNVAVKMERD